MNELTGALAIAIKWLLRYILLFLLDIYVWTNDTSSILKSYVLFPWSPWFKKINVALSGGILKIQTNEKEIPPLKNRRVWILYLGKNKNKHRNKEKKKEEKKRKGNYRWPWTTKIQNIFITIESSIGGSSGVNIPYNTIIECSWLFSGCCVLHIYLWLACGCT